MTAENSISDILTVEQVGAEFSLNAASIEGLGDNPMLDQVTNPVSGGNETPDQVAIVIQSLLARLRDRETQLLAIKEVLAVRDAEFGKANETIDSLEQTIEGFKQTIESLNQALADCNREMAGLLASTSWKITAPLRSARRIFKIGPVIITLRGILSETARQLWHRLPVSVEHKLRTKDFFFRRLPFLFHWSLAYRHWLQQNSPANHYELYAEPGIQAGIDESPIYFMPLLNAPPLQEKPVRLIAFYLPQFHAIPENNEWWGEGFTEWTNVNPARPQFQGHYQPHVPGELGYYNLLDANVQRRQIGLAKTYGLEGFCFYFYWFGGKRLLEAPILNYLSDASLDLPFCLCWANENWSRRWDGLHDEILIAQQHSVEDDTNFIAYISKYLKDPRYIRINDKPLLLVYRPGLLPSAKATARLWREWCRTHGIGEIYLAYTQSFEIVNPARYGFDAAIEFPPNLADARDLTGHIKPLTEKFAGQVYDWSHFIQRSRKYQAPTYKLFRGVCPSWDNTARRKNRGTIFVNNTPALYRVWLRNAIQDTRLRFKNLDERLVFVNAWNEWAEGAHLEPDARHGYAWLQATRDALLSQADPHEGITRRVLIVSHDAYPHGAQYLVLNMLRELATTLHCEVEVICLGGGPLKTEFAKYGHLYDLAEVDPQGSEADKLVADLFRRGFHHAIVNTTVSAVLLPTLKQAGLRCVALIHELRELIVTKRLQSHARLVAEYADHVVFPALPVYESFAEFAAIPENNVSVRAQGLYKRNRYANSGSTAARSLLRTELGLSDEAQLVLGVGYADSRKGIDYFIDIAARLAASDSRIHCVWVGHWEASMQVHVADLQAQRPEIAANLHCIGRRDDTSIYYAGADVFALTSREDPFPSVVLESMDVGLPIVAFAGAGGSNALLDEGVGINVPIGDTAAFAQAVQSLLTDRERHAEMGRIGRRLIAERYSFRHYLYDVLALAGLELPRVSVIVPNYNYAPYIKARLNSIARQTVPLFEWIILDDASTDGSVDAIREWLSENSVEARLVVNDSNSGNVFEQWRKGVALAKGDFVWIAEADDLCRPDLLEVLLASFADPGVVLSYCESAQIDQHGNKMAADYRYYVADIGSERWHTAYVREGRAEIAEALAIKNTIPNVSGVLFKRPALLEVLEHDFEAIRSLRHAGDWLTYVRLLAKGKVAFTPAPANTHRRHTGSVIGASSGAPLIAEIAQVQQIIAHDFSVTPDAAVKAAEYLRTLEKQFGVERKP